MTRGLRRRHFGRAASRPRRHVSFLDKPDFSIKISSVICYLTMSPPLATSNEIQKFVPKSSEGEFLVPKFGTRRELRVSLVQGYLQSYRYVKPNSPNSLLITSFLTKNSPSGGWGGLNHYSISCGNVFKKNVLN